MPKGCDGDGARRLRLIADTARGMHLAAPSSSRMHPDSIRRYLRCGALLSYRRPVFLAQASTSLQSQMSAVLS